MRMPGKKAVTNVRLPEELFWNLKEEAAKERRTVSSLIQEAIEDVISKIQDRREGLAEIQRKISNAPK